MPNSTRVIFLIATYNQAKLLEDCLKYCNKLDPQPEKYIFCENNSTDNTLKVISDFNHPKELIRLWVRDDAITVRGNPYAVIGMAREMLLKRARQLDPDYMIFIDSDIMILYPHFIEQIIGHGKNIVGAPYLRPFPKGMFLASMWKRNGGPLWYKKQCQGFQKCALTSAGCLCLSRKTLQDKRLHFDPPIWNKKRKASEDFSYCIRARKLGYRIWIDCNLRIGHYATASDRKPWMTKRDKKGKNIGYVDFSYDKANKT